MKVLLNSFYVLIITLGFAANSYSTAEVKTNNEGLSYAEPSKAKPNFIVIVAEDISAHHFSKAGYKFVSTPNFDAIANQGVYFKNAYTAAPTCMAARTALLSSQHIWRTDAGAVFVDAVWKEGMPSWQDILKENGYYTGHAGKAWTAKFNNKERPTYHEHPAGKAYFILKKAKDGEPPPPKEIHGRPNYDWTGNLEAFYAEAKHENKAFSLWIGTTDAHAPFEEDGVSRFDDVPEHLWRPGFMSSNAWAKNFLEGYLDEVESFDRTLGEVRRFLAKHDLTDNTVVIVTSDHGIAASRAKTTNYDYGVRVPLAIQWPAGLKKPGRSIDDMVSLTDIGPTILKIAGLDVPEQMTGKSLKYVLDSDNSGQIDPSRTYVLTAFERHSALRSNNQKTYPRRAIHTHRYALIRNYFPDRWPWGRPPNFGEFYFSSVWDEEGKVIEPYFSLAVSKRPYEELYDLKLDPFQLNNVIDDPEYADIKNQLIETLDEELTTTGDPVHLTKTDYFSQFVHQASVLNEKDEEMEDWSEQQVRDWFIKRPSKNKRYVCRYDWMSYFYKSCKPEKFSMFMKLVFLGVNPQSNADSFTPPVKEKRYVCQYDLMSYFYKSCKPEKINMILKIILLKPYKDKP